MMACDGIGRCNSSAEERRGGEIGAELNNYILMARYANVPGVALEDAFLPLLLLFPRVTSVQHLSLFQD